MYLQGGYVRQGTFLLFHKINAKSTTEIIVLRGIDPVADIATKKYNMLPISISTDILYDLRNLIQKGKLF